MTQRRQVDEILRKAAAEGGRAHPDVDYSKASRGRADFVKVSDWGGGDGDEDLANLKVESYANSYSDNFVDAPLFEELTKRLTLLETNHELSVASVRDLPPFERWAFRREHYAQYLADLRAVHTSLESAIDAAAGAAAAMAVEAKRGKAKGAAELAASADALLSPLMEPEMLGVRRAQALSDDLEALLGPEGDEAPAPTTNAAAYAKLVSRFGAKAADCESDLPARVDAARALFSHAVCVYLALLGTGQRFGARAVEALPQVRERRALSTYARYPERVGNPLVALSAAVDAAGASGAVDEAARERLMAELPSAIQRTSVLLAPLAVADKATE